MIYGETHAEQKVSRLIPKRRFGWRFWRQGEFHSGRKFRFHRFWVVQIGRYPLEMGPLRMGPRPGNMPLNGSQYVVWGVFETKARALEHASDEIRTYPWFY